MQNSNNFDKFYIAALYLVVGFLLVFNLVSLFSGHIWSLLPATVQLVVIVSLLLRTTWSWIAVRVWAILATIAGVAMWLAIALRGGEIMQATSTVFLNTGMLLIGFFFLVFAKQVLGKPRAA